MKMFVREKTYKKAEEVNKELTEINLRLAAEKHNLYQVVEALKNRLHELAGLETAVKEQSENIFQLQDLVIELIRAKKKNKTVKRRKKR